MSTRHPRPRLGISSCLLGSNVRYDGGNKRNEFLLKTLGPYVDWVTVCPEVDIGLGTPRPPIELVHDVAGGIRLVMPEMGEDLTERMTSYAHRRVAALHAERLSGYVLKGKSPSCGMERVPVHDEGGDAPEVGAGLFAAVLKQRMPQLPVEEEGRLEDPRVRENFVTRIFSRARWQELEDTGFTTAALTRFHAQHKYLLMSRDPGTVGILLRLLDEFREAGTNIPTLAESYGRQFNRALSKLPTRRSHTNALLHIAACVSKQIDANGLGELRKAIGGYRAGVVGLSGPVSVLRKHARKYGIGELSDQVYLQPHPDELNLLA